MQLNYAHMILYNLNALSRIPNQKVGNISKTWLYLRIIKESRMETKESGVSWSAIEWCAHGVLKHIWHTSITVSYYLLQLDIMNNERITKSQTFVSLLGTLEIHAQCSNCYLMRDLRLLRTLLTWAWKDQITVR